MIDLDPKAVDSSFVLLELANHRFALPSGLVSELAPPVRLHSFPHGSSLLAGVIVRRGRIVPVYDAPRALSGKPSLAHRFYLIARRDFSTAAEMSAIPVDGECELVSGKLQPRPEDAAPYISGTIAIGGETIGVLDLGGLAEFHAQQQTARVDPEVRR